MYGEVTIPAPVLTVRTQDLSMQLPASACEDAWVVRIWCGENVLFERKYRDGEEWEAEDNAYSKSRAEEMCLEEFTRRLRKVLDDAA